MSGLWSQLFDLPPADDVVLTLQIDKKYAGQNATVELQFKDYDGNFVFSKQYSTQVDELGVVKTTITGESPDPVLSLADWGRMFTLCTTVHLEDGSEATIMNPVTSIPRANYSGYAENAGSLNNNTLSDQPISVLQFMGMQTEEKRTVLVESETSNQIKKLDVTDFVRCEKAKSPVNGEEIDVLRIGSGSPKPIFFGGSTPDSIQNYITMCALLEDLFHAFGVKTLPLRSPVQHNTAAIFADNSANEMSAGLLAQAQTWGVYASGQNGAVAITNGPANGAGTTGFVATAPASGGFKYALYANSNGLTGSWAAALFGNSFHTGTLTMSSDARLKSEVRAQSHTLDKVMLLKPSQYTYRQDTPFGLPQGLHHGFLAQEMEEIFPELVSDISMPLSLDPQEMYKSETTTYKGINYIEMISILTSALQELNAKVDKQAKEIHELHALLKK
jgi:hypothetical protein